MRAREAWLAKTSSSGGTDRQHTHKNLPTILLAEPCTRDDDVVLRSYNLKSWSNSYVLNLQRVRLQKYIYKRKYNKHRFSIKTYIIDPYIFGQKRKKYKEQTADKGVSHLDTAAATAVASHTRAHTTHPLPRGARLNFLREDSGLGVVDRQRPAPVRVLL